MGGRGTVSHMGGLHCDVVTVELMLVGVLVWLVGLVLLRGISSYTHLGRLVCVAYEWYEK